MVMPYAKSNRPLIGVLHATVLLLCYVTTSTNAECSYDWVFILDNSGSVGSSHFQLLKYFVTNISSAINIGLQENLVAVISYSDNATLNFGLTSYTEKSSLLQAIRAVPYTGGGTNTAAALQLLQSNTLLGLRNRYPNIAIVLTDGRSNNGSETLRVASNLHATNLYDILTIGVVGRRYYRTNLEELKGIASHNDYAFVSSNFTAAVLQNYAENIVTTLCFTTITQHPEGQLIDLFTNNLNISLKCRATGLRLIYSWTRNNLPIVPNDHYMIIGSDLAIINVTPFDDGHYQCIVRSFDTTVSSRYATVIVNVPAPRIVTHPVNLSAAAPFSAAFTCAAQAHGTVTIEWKRINSVIPNKANSTQQSLPDITTSNLTVPNVTGADAGTYYCVAWANRKGSLSKEAMLLYAGSPMLPMIALSDPVVLLNASNFNLSMRCYPDSIDHHYEWRKRNANLPARAQGVFSSQLILSNIRPEDSGKYQCVISNSTGKIASVYSVLKVEVSLPVFLRHPVDAKVEVYKSVSFLCEVSGFGNITIIWKRIGFKLPITSKISVSKAGDMVTSILEITRTSGFYAGQYYCISKNSAGEVRSQIAKLTTQGPCPEMIRQPKNITVFPGETANFSCFALSHSGLIYEWTRSDDKPLPVMSQKTVSKWLFLPTFNQITAIRTLMIFNSQPPVEGWYCCTAINDCRGGGTKLCAWLEVNTIPIIDKHPVSTKSRQRNEQSTVMSCSATGMGPIHYKWEKYQSSSNSWIRPSHRVVNITSPKLTFSVITEEDEGVYHCVVTNDDGSVISDNATLTVYGPPTIHSISSKLISFEGEKVNLTCSASNDVDSSESLTIFWYGPRGTQLTSIMKNVNIYLKDDSITAQNTSILLMDSVNNTDTGQYTCRAFNHPKSYSEKKTSLDVEYSPRVTIVPSSEQRVNVGMRLLLYCEAHGQPVSMVQWYRDKIPVIPIAKEFQQLYSVPTDSPHTTVYTCVGRNNAGNMPRKTEKSVKVTVQVTCPPPNDPKNGDVFIKQDGGSLKAKFICHLGFKLMGNDTVNCIKGIWSSSLPKCI